MPPIAIMQDLEYLIQILKLCEKELTKNSIRGCDGCNPLEGIDCYALKCTKITLNARISVFITTHPSFCMS